MTKPNGTFNWRDGVSLKEYVESRLTSLREYLESRLDNMEIAVKTADDAMQYRLKGMNEINDMAKNQAATYALKTDMRKVEDDIKVLRESKANLEGKASQQSVTVALGIGLAGMLIALASLIMGVVAIFK